MNGSIKGDIICNGILISHKKENPAFVMTWMDFDGVMLSEPSKTEKDKYHIYHIYHIYVEF